VSRVLIVEDDAALRDALLDTLRAEKIDAAAAGDAAEALRCLSAERFELVVSDVHMPGSDGIELLSTIKKRWPHLPVVLMTAYATVAKAVAAMREGAADYVVKPFDAASLINLVRRQLSVTAAPADLIAIDPESERCLQLARKIALSDATVLLSGESGTGKEVYARYIRDQSARADKAFVAINCAAIPENMLEATLFGYERGAFTGALTAHAGKFEQAQGGILLLDEISEMDLALQAKILRVLQEREVERLGSSKTIALDVRLIATSNRDLAAEVQVGRFRADLYYRINVMSLRLPSLRNRRADILPLARRAVIACADRSRPQPSLSASAEAKLMSHSWPGNVRELNNVVQRAVLLCSGTCIDADALEIGGHAAVPMIAELPARDAGLDHDLKTRERELILTTLHAAGGSRKLAAERLGISARTLRHKLQQFKADGITVPSGREAVPLRASA
jgi:two-component system, response regulator FlrC